MISIWALLISVAKEPKEPNKPNVMYIKIMGRL
jgi:hypothetical protein